MLLWLCYDLPQELRVRYCKLIIIVEVGSSNIHLYFTFLTERLISNLNVDTILSWFYIHSYCMTAEMLLSGVWPAPETEENSRSLLCLVNGQHIRQQLLLYVVFLLTYIYSNTTILDAEALCQCMPSNHSTLNIIYSCVLS